MRRTEMTSEQMFQEAYFADKCLESNDPVFVARGKRILKSHEEELLADSDTRTDNSRDIWVPDPEAGVDEDDPRSTLAYRNFRNHGLELTFNKDRAVPVELAPNESVDPSKPIH